MKVKVRVAQSCGTLWDPMNYTVHGILQDRILERVAFPFSRGSSQPRDRTQVSRTAGRFFTVWATREAQQHEWVAYPFLSGSSQPRNRAGVSCIAGGFFTNWAIREAQSIYILPILNLLDSYFCHHFPISDHLLVKSMIEGSLSGEGSSSYLTFFQD